MNNRPLIFSASIGQGHYQAALSLQKQMLTDQHFHPEIIDVFEGAHPFVTNFIKRSYLWVIQKRPEVWKKIYVEMDSFQFWLKRVLNAYVKTFAKLLNEKQPPFIISTHPISTWLLGLVKEFSNNKVPLFSVITDFSFHRAYLIKNVDAYFTVDATTLNLNIMMDTEIKPMIFNTGIPFPSKLSMQNQLDIRKKLQIPENKRTILIASGGEGLFDFVKIISLLQTLPFAVTIICMVGFNQSIVQKINKVSSKHEIIIHHFTDSFLEFVQCSDVMISKAGGLTLSEALASGTPLIIYRPIAGHEEENALILENWGAALYARNQKDLINYIRDMLADSSKRESLVRSAQKYKKPHASKEIMEHIYHHYGQQRVFCDALPNVASIIQN
ncbi:MGDG synthase family glycosyltransferase [Alkalihalobacillus trypoxylicola]|uniref:Galactosyldiacylglycerol synthase n=1 Tax=Alkalihalobacillus trypoxylicola TaxID=519424 RepID=A0A162EEU2_9BACI|nr:glycosyltransferase [Alkalihalobacillus trypoxylicola]KYG32406.1 hypothetical protein AZF04_06495 [Alkalihalobacillus trypoxylicola]